VLLNGRYIRDRFVQHAIKEAHRGLVDVHNHPVVFLFLTIDPAAVDVNVHPTKIEVRWRESGLVHSQVLSALPDGLDTPLAPEGYPLSGGEVQRLMVARAIAGVPSLILFDGTLDRLAPEDRDGVLDTLFRPDASWTLVVSSDEPAVLERCERVLELPGGELAVDGSRNGDPR